MTIDIDIHQCISKLIEMLGRKMTFAVDAP